MNTIYCLSISRGVPLTDEESELLLLTAHRMHRKDQRKSSIKSSGIQGWVTTKNQHVMLGTVSGIQFSAVLERERGTSTIEYIVRPCDLSKEPRRMWVSGQDADDILNARQAALN